MVGLNDLEGLHLFGRKGRKLLIFFLSENKNFARLFVVFFCLFVLFCGVFFECWGKNFWSFNCWYWNPKSSQPWQVGSIVGYHQKYGGLCLFC